MRDPPDSYLCSSPPDNGHGHERLIDTSPHLLCCQQGLLLQEFPPFCKVTSGFPLWTVGLTWWRRLRPRVGLVDPGRLAAMALEAPIACSDTPRGIISRGITGEVAFFPSPIPSPQPKCLVPMFHHDIVVVTSSGGGESVNLVSHLSTLES